MTTLLKCKMCGGTLEIQENETVARCKYCGSLMTLPKIDNEKKARIFNRANEYRLNNEFDKAYDAYKSIVEEDPTEAEAYWGMILSEYGIEYVEDPRSGKRIPTCHRTQTQPIQGTINYKNAIQYADPERRMMYQEEAEGLDKIQRRILAISSKEEPYDVFISYKETDDNTGERTEDSVIAQDIYNELNRAGFKTFFSRITLGKHLGENYEPYIYAALTSAKVLITVSTSAEHLDAVWVRNEWMRFLHMMDSDQTKVIIPVYKGMSPYELPYVLSGFQSQDMSKIGAVQELVSGVERILNKKELSEKDVLLNQLLEKQKKEVEAEKKRLIDEQNRKEEEERRRKERLKDEEEKRQRKAAAWRKNRKYVFSVISLTAFLVVTAVLFVFIIQPKQKLDQAITLIEAGNYDEGYAILEELSQNDLIAQSKYDRAVSLIKSEEYDTAYLLLKDIDYKDSKNKVNEIIRLKLSKADIGQTIMLGSFEQDGNSENGKEDIEWIILDKENDKVLLISRFGLSAQAYHQNASSTNTWETSDVRKWLNGFLFENAFSEKEKELVVSTFIKAENMAKYSSYLTPNDTNDNLFLLSLDEAKKYFSSNEDRLLKPTQTSINEGARINEEGHSWWWLRSTGFTIKHACFVSDTGKVDEEGFLKGDIDGVVRPALWVKIN